MDRPLWFRLLNASALALFVGGLSVGAIGFVTADDGPADDVPDRLVLPEPRVGDRGSYNLSLVRDTSDGPQIVRDEHVLFEFEWLEPEVQRDVGGQAHFVNRLLEVPYGFDEEGTFQQYAPPVWAFDAVDQALVSYSYLHSQGDEDSQVTMRQTMMLDEDDLHTAPCGFDLRGRDPVLDLGGKVEPFWYCSWEAYWSSEPIGFVARGMQDLGGIETVYLSTPARGSFGGSEVHLWLSEDLPYPVRMAVEDQQDPGLFHVVRLVAFDRGSKPLAMDAGPAAALPEAPPLRHGQPEPWGMPEGPVDHPFPLSEAYKAALEHPDADDLRAFLDEHPEAIVVEARYREHEEDGDKRHRWHLLWHRDGAFFGAEMVLEPQPPAGPLDILFPPAAQIVYSPGTGGGYRDYMDGEDIGRFLPDGMPTAASLMERWRVAATEGHGGSPPNAYGFSLPCMDATCSRAFPSFEAGHRFNGRTTEEDGGPLPGGPPTTTTVDRYSLLEVRFDSATGTDWTLRESSSIQGAEGGGPVGAGDPRTLTTYTTPVWGFPSAGAVAGAGAAALLVGVVYLLWPSLKAAGFMGLFSRVRHDALLDHPSRRAVYQAIEARPGIHYRELLRVTGRPDGTLQHHLGKLRQGGLVTAVDGPGHTCYFVKGTMDHGTMRAAPVLKSEGARRLLEAARGAPGASPAELARRAAMSPQTAHYHLHRLEEAGLLATTRAERQVSVRPTALAEQAAGLA